VGSPTAFLIYRRRNTWPITPLKHWDKNGKYVFYCSSGLRSDIVMDLLKKQGYTNLYSFKKMKRYKGELARG
jgi:rhodanese-related sulfurtransferase